MKHEYSFLKGLAKTATSVAIYAVGFAVAILAMNFSAIYDLSLWTLVEQYLKPVLGTLTVGGSLVFIQNWLKNR